MAVRRKQKSSEEAAAAPAKTESAEVAPLASAGGTASRSPAGAYEVSRPLGVCSATNEPIEPAEKFHAALRETPTGMERLDIKLSAWEAFPKQHVLASWVTTMPLPGEQKKKVFVDDEVLLTLFERLGDTVEPAKIRFRFVLGLILMRKRLITYESQAEEKDGTSVWTVRVRGKPQQPLALVNPHLTEEAVGEVSTQLGEILNSEL